MKALPGSIRTEKGGLESTSEHGPKTGAETDGRRHAGVGACALPHTFLPFKNTLPLIHSSEKKERKKFSGFVPSIYHWLLQFQNKMKRRGVF